MKTITVEIGALCEPLSKQLAGILPEAELQRFDADVAAVTQLVVRGHLSDGAADKARRSILRRLQRTAKDALPTKSI